VKVGDLVSFPETGYTAVILELTDYDHVRMLVTQPVDFKNPTWMSMRDLKRCAEIVSSAESNT
jgi:hypothetical protein